jgi:hypothetical protein
MGIIETFVNFLLGLVYMIIDIVVYVLRFILSLLESLF